MSYSGVNENQATIAWHFTPRFLSIQVFFQWQKSLDEKKVKNLRIIYLIILLNFANYLEEHISLEKLGDGCSSFSEVFTSMKKEWKLLQFHNKTSVWEKSNVDRANDSISNATHLLECETLRLSNDCFADSTGSVI